MPRTAAACASVSAARHFTLPTSALHAPVRIALDPPPSFTKAGGRAAQAPPKTPFSLEDPDDMTVAALSEVRCPLCHEPFPLKGLLSHVFNDHQQLNLDKEIVRRSVRARYSLLKAAEKREGLSVAGSAGGAAPPPVTHATVTGYPCRHCGPGAPPVVGSSLGLFPSVDAVMKHIGDAHPEVDLDDEPIPAKTTRTAAKPSDGGGGSGNGRGPGKVAMPKLSVPKDPFSVAAFDQHLTVPPAPKEPELEPLVFTDTQFPCEICRKVFGSEKDLIQHLDDAHADDIAEADDGPSAFIDPAALAVSKAAAAPTPEQQARVASYIPSTTNPISVKCTLCVRKPKLFTTEVALHAHIVQKHPDVNAATKVREMMEVGTAVESFPCPECGKMFLQEGALLGHIQSKHPHLAVEQAEPAEGAVPPPLPEVKNGPPPGGVWWCNDCNKGFKSGSALTGHLSTKHGLPTQSLPCPGCKRVFPDMWALKNHVQQAHRTLDDSLYDDDNISYKCDFCTRRFLTSSALAVHTKKMHGR